LTEADFFSRYERLSGLAVDPQRLYYFQVFVGYVQAVISLATTYRIARNGKTHQDALQAWILGIGSNLLGSLRDTLERGV
jgi:aminoglycoside phosphotransferase (APT) family kinase protein